jgi:MFS family permease
LIPTVILIFTTSVFFLLFKERDGAKHPQFTFRAIRNRQAWLVGLVWGFFNMGFYSYVTWAGTFFIEMKNIPSSLAFFLVSLMTLTMIPVGPVAGILSDRFGKKIFVVTSVFVMSISFLFIPYLMLPLLLLPIMTLSISNSLLPAPIFSLQSKVLPAAISGLSFGIFATCSSAGQTFSPYLVGLTRDVFPGSAPVFFVMAIFCFLSFICALFIKTKR